MAAGGNPRAYVRRALVTTATSWRRRLSSTEQVLQEIPERPHHDPDPERSTAMMEALRGLPPRMRAVVVLRYYEDRTEAQTAELLGCSVGTVKTQASRAMGRLRTALADQAPAHPAGGRR